VLALWYRKIPKSAIPGKRRKTFSPFISPILWPGNYLPPFGGATEKSPTGVARSWKLAAKGASNLEELLYGGISSPQKRGEKFSQKGTPSLGRGFPGGRHPGGFPTGGEKNNFPAAGGETPARGKRGGPPI